MVLIIFTFMILLYFSQERQDVNIKDLFENVIYVDKALSADKKSFTSHCFQKLFNSDISQIS